MLHASIVAERPDLLAQREKALVRAWSWPLLAAVTHPWVLRACLEAQHAVRPYVLGCLKVRNARGGNGVRDVSLWNAVLGVENKTVLE